ncbi:hypothetical protein ABZ260_50805 [Streptosporangium sp. NPDC006013]|uniref:hypothetical protein n=1 Tax=Streptosporangium sp. NPDC006013 TaxID=3155596 RepID=UPI0033A1FA91
MVSTPGRSLGAAARLLSVRLSRPVTAAFAATGTPSIAEALERLRSGPAPRIALASYLLAPGFFQDRLETSGADLVAAPLGVDADLAALVWARFDQACPAPVTLDSDRRRLVSARPVLAERNGRW